MVKLGRIHPEKFTLLQPFDDGPVKFLKRALWRTGSNGALFLDTLFSLPISAFVDQHFDRRRTIPASFNKSDRYKKIVKQVGAVLWDIRDNYLLAMHDSEWDLLLDFLRKIYAYCRLPMRGFAGAFFFPEENKSVQMLVPPLTGFDPRKTDWLEYLFTIAPSGLFLPLFGMIANITVPVVDDEFVTALHPGYKMLEDLGYIESEGLKEAVSVWTEDNRRRAKLLLKRGGNPDNLKPLYLCRCLLSIPSHFHFLFSGPTPVEKTFTIAGLM